MASFSSSPTVPLSSGTRLLPSPSAMAGDAAYLVAGLPIGVVAFSVLVTGLATAAGLAITLAGIPIAVATLYAARLLGDLERRRAAMVLGAPVARTPRPWTGSAWARCKAALTDAGAWRDTLWGLLLLPVGVAGFTAAVTAWSVAVGLVTSPLWHWALPDDRDQPHALHALDGDSLGAGAARVALGLVLVPAAAWGCRALASASARAARAVLAH